MKAIVTRHLCLTQSPLITRVFQAAMKEMAVPQEAICSISRRSVKPAGKGVCLDDLSDRMESRYKKFDRAVYQKLKQKLIDQVDEITGGEAFLAYIPHTQRLMYQEIIAHPNCGGYVFVEEGFTSMAWLSHQNGKYHWGKRLQYLMRSRWTGSSFELERDKFDVKSDGFQGAVSLSRHAFTGMPKVMNVAKWISRYKSGGECKKAYAILDTSYLHREIRWNDYENALVEAILRKSAEGFGIFIKFHFVDDKAAERFLSIEQKLAGRAGAPSLLRSDFSIEEQLTVDDCMLFAVSSAGYYAALFGGAVECFAEHIKGMELDRWMEKNLLPMDFREVAGLAKENRISLHE